MEISVGIGDLDIELAVTPRVLAVELVAGGLSREELAAAGEPDRGEALQAGIARDDAARVVVRS